MNELIEILRTYPSYMRVVVNGHEDGYDDLRPELIYIRTILLRSGTEDWEGAHGDLDFVTEGPDDDSAIVEALVFQRSSN